MKPPCHGVMSIADAVPQAQHGTRSNRLLVAIVRPAHRREISNSRMKLTVSLAAQRVLRSRCLRRLPAAYASVRKMMKEPERTERRQFA